MCAKTQSIHFHEKHVYRGISNEFTDKIVACAINNKQRHLKPEKNYRDLHHSFECGTCCILLRGKPGFPADHKTL